ncbi:MAG: hypothetical protein ICV60_19720, partial [Pyrinomonadaceae bacterium]|nr:hypothetical protein [Pyrinomonadaceae bacterium]
MSVTRFRVLFILTLVSVFAFGTAAFAQDSQGGNSSVSAQTRTRTVSNGQKMKIKGTVVRRDADTFTIRDMNGMDTVV